MVFVQTASWAFTSPGPGKAMNYNMYTSQFTAVRRMRSVRRSSGVEPAVAGGVAPPAALLIVGVGGDTPYKAACVRRIRSSKASFLRRSCLRLRGRTVV